MGPGREKTYSNSISPISVGDFDKVASAATLRGQLWILTADYSNNTMRTKAQTLLTKRGIINKLFLTKTQWKIQVNSSMLYHSIGKLQIEIKIDTNTQHVL